MNIQNTTATIIDLYESDSSFEAVNYLRDKYQVSFVDMIGKSSQLMIPANLPSSDSIEYMKELTAESVNNFDSKIVAVIVPSEKDETPRKQNEKIFNLVKTISSWSLGVSVILGFIVSNGELIMLSF